MVKQRSRSSISCTPGNAFSVMVRHHQPRYIRVSNRSNNTQLFGPTAFQSDFCRRIEMSYGQS